MRAIGFLLCAGCLGSVHRPSCALDAEVVADDEVTAIGTVQDLLARAVGVWDEPAVLEDGTAVTATVEVARGVGDAELVHSEPYDEVTPRFGLGDLHLDILVICSDFLRVPAVGSVATDAGDIDATLDGELTRSVSDEIRVGDELWATAPFAGAGFPDPVDPDLADFDDPEAFLRVSFLDDGTTTGLAGWSGHRETEEFSESRAHYLVTWPPDAN